MRRACDPSFCSAAAPDTLSALETCWQDNRLVLCAAREARPGANLRVALRRECVREDSV